MGLLLAVTWPQFATGFVLTVVVVVVGAFFISAFMRGARAEGQRRRIEQETRDRAAGEAALARSRELWRVHRRDEKSL